MRNRTHLVASTLVVGLLLLASMSVLATGVDVSDLVSHEDGFIVFQSLRTGPWQIFLTDAEGSRVVQLTPDSVPAMFARVSPDGKRVAFDTTVDGKRNIYTMNIDGSDLKAITTVATEDRHPSWSPDGEYVVFHSRGDGHTDWEIYTIKADGTEMRRLTFSPGTDAWPVWSPDGSQIAYSSDGAGGYSIYLINPDGSNQRRVLGTSGGRNPAWSPDGKYLAYASNTEGYWEIYVTEVATGLTRRLTHDPFEDTVPSWSPDGTQIIFTSNRDGERDLYIMDAADGSNIRRLFPDGKERNEYGSWLKAATE